MLAALYAFCVAFSVTLGSLDCWIPAVVLMAVALNIAVLASPQRHGRTHP